MYSDPDIAIPAMTSPEERQCYYRLTREQVDKGAIIEMGSWLGASTHAIASAVKHSGEAKKVHVYDRFRWDPSHDKKGAPSRDNLGNFKANLGDLMDYVEVHRGEISAMRWTGGPVSLAVFDAPKRIPAISQALTALAGHMGPGSVMAWQDFGYFPSYDIPAAITVLQDKLEFLEAVPGTTAVFRVLDSWTADDVSPRELALSRWLPEDINRAWKGWIRVLPKAMRPRFACGAALFLYDIGEKDWAIEMLKEILSIEPDAVLPKWHYLISERNDMRSRYGGLVKVIEAHVA